MYANTHIFFRKRFAIFKIISALFLYIYFSEIFQSQKISL